MCNIISLTPDPRDSAQSAAPPTKWLATQAGHGASNYITGRKNGCGFLAVRYLVVGIILRGSIGSEQSVCYS